METLKKEQQREMEILKIEFEDQHKSLVSQLEEAKTDKTSITDISIEYSQGC